MRSVAVMISLVVLLATALIQLALAAATADGEDFRSSLGLRLLQADLAPAVSSLTIRGNTSREARCPKKTSRWL
jgi:hypothetical protein